LSLWRTLLGQIRAISWPWHNDDDTIQNVITTIEYFILRNCLDVYSGHGKPDFEF